jgi:hypothetical protein
MCILSPTQTVGRVRLRSQNFACELINFACETILFRQMPRKLLKSLWREMADVAVSRHFKGLRPILFRALFSPSVFRSTRRAWSQFSFSELTDSTNSIPGKVKTRSPECTFVRFPGIDRPVRTTGHGGAAKYSNRSTPSWPGLSRPSTWSNASNSKDFLAFFEAPALTRIIL